MDDLRRMDDAELARVPVYQPHGFIDFHVQRVLASDPNPMPRFRLFRWLPR